MRSRVSNVIAWRVHDFSVSGFGFLIMHAGFARILRPPAKNTVYVQLTMMIYRLFTRENSAARSRWSPNPCRLLVALRRGLPPAWWRVSAVLAAALPAPSVRP